MYSEKEKTAAGLTAAMTTVVKITPTFEGASS
jgi:hypothetical protein